MKFRSEEELQGFINNLQYLNMGSQGTCYLRNKKVFKIFHRDLDDDEDYIIEHDKNEILRFSNIDNKTFIWPKDVIELNNEVIGYVSDYVDAKNLYKINPLNINLNRFIKNIKEAKKDIKIISNNGIVTYDMMYNTLYGRRFYCIDQDEYSFSEKDPKLIEQDNNNNFDIELYYFLIDNYFDNIIKNNKELSELYKYKKEDILVFIELLKKYLSELVGKDITALKDAKKYVIKSNRCTYQRY